MRLHNSYLGFIVLAIGLAWGGYLWIQKSMYVEENGLRASRTVSVVLPKRVGESKEVRIPLANRTNHEIEIVGTKSECDCMIPTAVVPLKISPGGRADLPVRIRVTESMHFETSFEKGLVLYHNLSDFGLAVSIRCTFEE